MSNIAEPKNCPKCGGPIPPEAPQGLCPKCLLVAASLATEAGPGTGVRGTPPALAELAAAFPQLEILEFIGQGGMGFVFKARQPKLDRLVALKILPQSLAADPAFAGRFTREGRLLARLSHPNIVAIHDFGQANGFFYLLMEFVDGVNLRQAMRAGRFTPAQALAVVPKVCDALQYAHNEGILHRDIKPENILLDAKGRVKIADFGIAKLVGDPLTRPSDTLSPSGGEGRGEGEAHALTQTGKILGTPQYMAPEQLERPQEVDHRADIYSLGVVFYEMLTGELPLGRFAPPSEKSTADPRLDDVVFRALEKEPARRTQSAGEVKTQVETITGSGGTPAGDRSPGPAGTGSGQFSNRVILAVALTVGSLLMFPFGIVIAKGMHLGPGEAIFVSLVILGIPGLVGTALGLVRLSELRHKPGQPRDFKPAVVATVVWPLVLLDVAFAAGFVGFFVSLLHSYRCPRLGYVLLFFGAMAVLGLDAILVRGLVRWTKRLPLVVHQRRLAAGAAVWTILFFGSLLWVVATFHKWSGVANAIESPELATNPPIIAGSTEVPLPPGYESGGPPPVPGYGTAPAASEAKLPMQEARFVIDAADKPTFTEEPGEQRWRLKLFIPPDHLASILWVRWSNGVPGIDPACSAYYKVGKAGGIDVPLCRISCSRIPESRFANLKRDELQSLLNEWKWSYPESYGLTNVFWCYVNLASGSPPTSSWLAMPPFHRAEATLPQSVRSGHQCAMRLLAFDTRPDATTSGWSGVELRFLLEPLKLPAIRMVPNEKDMGTYIAGTGLAGTMDDALKAMQQWPSDP